ncbi:zinc finger protein 618 isoform X2 [Vombatus ursinus]|uniref:zinc finger protein 618 isoform X2 n=1 Tax=Vombatus ursinus TaxID=29139 RepID=UPI000FFD5422|nr:zinc finger protein 618 isoform X2 [Vombatus ursinus]
MAEGAGATGRRNTAGRERLKRSPKSAKAEGSSPVPAETSLCSEQGTMTDVKVKTELPDDYIREVIWQDDAKESKKNVKDGSGDVPAEICVVIGGVRNQQTLGSYECGICGKKYKYYNCFQTHVRAHRDTEAASGEGASQGNNFRYTCDICGKKYKYYSCFQEHRDLHAVDVFSVEGAPENRADPFDQSVVATDEVKEEPPEPFQKIGPKTGNYTCEFCGKQYKYYTPYQEHVALHAPISTSAGWEPSDEPDTSSECSHPEFSRSPLFMAVKTQASQSGKKTPASIVRCSTLLQRTSSGAPPASQTQMFRAPNSGSPGSKATTESAFSRRVESKAQNNFEETNSSSQNSSEAASPLISNPFPLLQKPYTCGACGIQFQFYNNLLEHMQSHAADNENNIAFNQPRSPPAVVEEKWKPQPQRNSTNNTSVSGSAPNSTIPEKERQNIAERLLRVMCADLGTLSVVSGKEFLKLAQTLVDSGARYGAFSVTEILGNFNTLALKHLPRMYNQVKVKVTCALGSNACLGIGVTCHSQSIGPDSCYILTAYQAEGNHIKSYVLGIKGVDIRDSGDFIHHWVQNVLSEFVMSEIRTVYVTDCRVNSSAFSKAGMCLRCSACALNSVVQSVLNKRTLQARNMHEVIELLNVCEDLAGSTGLSKETFGSLEETSPPPCWNSVTDSLLLVHERYEQICEFYSRAKKMNLIQNLNKHLLSNLAAILAPVKQAVIELSHESRPTLQLVLPTYVKLEKLFTSKANDAGVVSKLCHLFLEALKENFKVHSAHKVAMILDPQQKLRPVPPYQHEEIIGKVCELINEVKESWTEEVDFEPSTKKPRAAGEAATAQEDDRFEKNEVYDYLQEPLFQSTPDLFQYWSCVTQKHTKLAKLAFWLLAVPAVGARSECVNMCEQALLIKRRRLLSPEDMNKLMFLKSNML